MFFRGGLPAAAILGWSGFVCLGVVNGSLTGLSARISTKMLCESLGLTRPFFSFNTLTDGIVSHLKKQAGPASVELKSEADFEKYIGDRDATVVGEDFILDLHIAFFIHQYSCCI